MCSKFLKMFMLKGNLADTFHSIIQCLEVNISNQMIEIYNFSEPLCIQESFEHNPSNSRGLKQASASLEDQTLHLTVRLQAEEEEQEEDQEEEIGGLINSDGEVVEWDARE